jgi:hypothetical protein
MQQAYVCRRNGAACPPHTPTPRKTPRRPAPVVFADCPDIREVLGLDRPRPSKNRPSTAGAFPGSFHAGVGGLE